MKISDFFNKKKFFKVRDANGDVHILNIEYIVCISIKGNTKVVYLTNGLKCEYEYAGTDDTDALLAQN